MSIFISMTAKADKLLIMNSQEDNLAAKMLSYNRANRAVAILCNHQVWLKFLS